MMDAILPQDTTELLQDVLTQNIVNVARGDAALEQKMREAIWSHGLTVAVGRDELMARAQKMFVPGGVLEHYRGFSNDVYQVIQTTVMAMNVHDDGMNRFANPGPFTVRNLVVAFNRYATSHVAASGEYAMRQDFEGTVFYLPPGVGDNDKVRDRMKEGRSVHVSTFVLPKTIDQSIHANVAMVFESLQLTFDSVGRPLAQDLRPACAIEGTKEAMLRLDHVSFGGKVNPCDSCSCEMKKGPWPR